MSKSSDSHVWEQRVLALANTRRSVLGACVFMLLAATACGFAGTGVDSGQNTLTVINGVDGPICSLRVKKASSQTFWGRNRLTAGQRLAPGESFEVRRLAAGRYDVDAHLCDDDTHPGYGRYGVAVEPNAAGTWIIGQ